MKVYTNPSLEFMSLYTSDIMTTSPAQFANDLTGEVGNSWSDVLGALRGQNIGE